MSITCIGARSVCLCSAVILLFHLKSFSQKVRRDTLPEVKVNARHNQIHSNSAIRGFQEMQSQEFNQTNSTGVAEAVRHFSGAQLIDYGGIGGLKTINIRSLGISQTGIYYDGIRISDIQNGQIDLGKYSLEGLDGLELSTAPETSLLIPASNYASAGSLFFNTATPAFSESATYHLRASVNAGSFSLFNPSILSQFRINQILSISVNIELKTASGKYPFHIYNGLKDSLLERENSAINSFRTEATAFADFKDSSKLRLKAYEYHSSRGLPGAVILNNISSNQHLWDQNFFLQSTYNKGFSKIFRLLISSKFNSDFTRYLDPDYFNLQGGLDNKYLQQEFYFSIANQFQITKSWAFSLSSDLSRNTMAANLYQFAEPIRNTLLSAIASSWKLNRFQLKIALLNTRLHETVLIGKNQNPQNVWSPSIIALWSPEVLTGLSFSAFYKDVIRLPTFNELYYIHSGNPLLKPEIAKQYDLGLAFSKSLSNNTKFAFHLDAYYNLVSNKIISIPTSNLFIWSTLNLGSVHIKGIESGLDAKFKIGSVNFNGFANLTWQNARDRTNGSFTYNELIPYTPVVSGSGSLAAILNHVGINYNLIYSGLRYSLRDNSSENYLAPWLSHDVACFYECKSMDSQKDSHKKHLISSRLAFEVSNLFAAQYEVIKSFPMPERSYRLRLSINY